MILLFRFDIIDAILMIFLDLNDTNSRVIWGAVLYLFSFCNVTEE